MIAIVLAATFGALLGLLMRNRVLSIATAVVGTGLVHIGAIFVAEAMTHSETYENQGLALGRIVGTSYWVVAPTLAAAGAGAALAAFMVLLMKLDRVKPVSLPGQTLDMPRPRDDSGRLRRAPGMIEERPIHEAAESRIQQILKL